MSVTKEREPMLTVAQVAEMLSVSPMTVYRLIRDGEFRHDGEEGAIRVGRCFRIHPWAADLVLRKGTARDAH